MSAGKSTISNSNQSVWKSLYYFNLYRLTIAVAFFAIGISGGNVASLGQRSPSLFITSSLVLMIVAVVSLMTITRGKPRLVLQACFQFGMDAILITLLSSASGGITSGFYFFLLVSVAACGIVLSRRMSLFFAAFGTLVTFIEYGYSHINYPEEAGSLTQIGLLGIAMFSTSLMINFLATRLKHVEARAHNSAAELLRVSRLNELVVASLETGIIVVDREGKIQLTNDKADSLLNSTHASSLSQVSALLHERLMAWQNGQENHSPIQFSEYGPNVAMRFAWVSHQTNANILIFLEDLSQTEKQAHQLKLAALGQLTGAVAHEIRNPLGAISHAGQLMAESKNLSETDIRLVTIVNQQSDRINAIIKSILGLGRPHMRKPLMLDLDEWLTHFKSVFVQTHQCYEDALLITPTKLRIYMDPDHLHQVITNLCENGMRHGSTGKVEISGGRQAEHNVPYLDIRNDGPGISVELQEKIFEPFFTTEGKGTGLGLYLARELCQDNDARLDYINTPKGGHFRIKFSEHANASE